MNHEHSEPEDTQSESGGYPEQDHSTNGSQGHRRSSGTGSDGSLAANRPIPPEGDGSAPLDAELIEEVTHQVTHEMMAMRSGPLPESAEYEGYERVLEGSADRILSMAELSAAAAAEATRANAYATRAAADSVTEDGATVKRGQIIFAVLTLAFLICSLLALALGHPIAAAFPFAASIAAGFKVVVTPINGDRWKPERKEATD